MDIDINNLNISFDNDSKSHLCFCSSVDNSPHLPNSQHHLDLASSTSQSKCSINKHTSVYTLLCDEIYTNGDFSSVEFINYLGNSLTTQFCRPVTILLVKKINSIVTNKLFCVLFDTGLDKTFVNLKALPNGTL